MSPTTIVVKRVKVAGDVDVFYREAGSPSAPVILLMHGFPSSSHQYRNLIPILAEKYRVIAPDLPGFGFTEVPEGYVYSFENLAQTTESFLDALEIKTFAVYIFDYGAPVSLRVALNRPKAITAIISQNGNMYEEGLGPLWAAVQEYWNDPTNQTKRDALRGFLTYDVTKMQYTSGEPHPDQIAPEGWTLDAALLARPGNQEIQLDLFLDYNNNVKLYPQFQSWLSRSGVPVLAIWGQHDGFFLPPGAEAFKRDAKDAEVHIIDAGHFALENNYVFIGEKILEFLKKQ